MPCDDMHSCQSRIRADRTASFFVAVEQMTHSQSDTTCASELSKNCGQTDLKILLADSRLRRNCRHGRNSAPESAGPDGTTCDLRAPLRVSL